MPFWGAQQSSAPQTPPKALKPGEFVWHPGIAPAGPIVVIVSLDDQLAFVYRNGVEIGYSTVSSGKSGHDTPTGVFTILQKDRDHHSSKYNNASMPYTQRLTWDGVALHAGGLPGLSVIARLRAPAIGVCRAAFRCLADGHDRRPGQRADGAGRPGPPGGDCAG